MAGRRSRYPLIALLLAGGAMLGVQVSGATFTSSSTTDVTVSAANDWIGPTVAVTSPGAAVRGTVTLTATASDARGTVASVELQYAAGSSTTWSSFCTDTVAPYSCTVDTTLAADGTYSLRAIATDDSGNKTTSAAITAQIDNTAPTNVVLTVPSGTLSGTVNLTSTASDATSGVATVAVQYRKSGATAWTDCGTGTSAPYTCALATASFTDGSYDFRSVATDKAGNTTASATVTRTVNNTVSSVSVTSPANGATARNESLTLTADASSNRGVTSVRIDTKLSSSSSWLAVCTDTTAPYTCAWDANAASNGAYDVRAVLVDGSGGVTTSSTVSFTVANTLSAQDVQVVTPGAATGRPQAGHKIVLTYSTVVNLSSILYRWDGSPTTITTNFYDRAATGSTDASRDNVDFVGSNLGQVSFVQDYLANRRTGASTTSTMSASTQTVNGHQVTVVTVTLGTLSGTFSTSAVAGAMLWYPSGVVSTSAGVMCSEDPATESGTNDRDF